MARNEDLMVRIKADIRELQRGLRQAARESDMAGKEIQRKLGPKVNDTMMAIGKSVGAAALAYVSFRSVLAGGEFIVRTAAQFEKLNAQLVTIEGSTERAQLAFERIESFASTTPFQLEEVVDAFIRLRSRGLEPSTDALMAYGNVASGMSKSLNQVIEAVADAATGEFERLKEFGIKASKQGDTIRFTFQGITTEVRNSASEIEAYLQSIGTVQFAGSMERQMDTLGGASSNLQDAIAKLALRIDSETGLTAALRSAMGVMTQWANNLSGVRRPIADIEADIDRLNGKLEGARNRRLGARGTRGAPVQFVEAEIEAARTELREALLASQDMAELDRGIGMLRQAIERQNEAIAATRESASNPNRRGRNRASSGNAVQAQIADLRELQAALDGAITKQQTLQEQASAPPQPEPASGGAGGSGDAEAKRRARELQAVREQQEGLLAAVRDRLMDEESLLNATHARELAAIQAINDSTLISEQDKRSLIEAMERDHQQKLDDLSTKRLDSLVAQEEAERAIAEQRLGRLRGLQIEAADAQAGELMRAADHHAQQMAQLAEFNEMELESIGGYNELKESLEADHQQRLADIRARYLQSGLDFLTHIKNDEVRTIADSAMRGIQVASTFSRKAFEIHKVAAIANAVVSARESIVDAFRWGTKLGGPALGAVFAATATAAQFANVAAIQSTQYGGGGGNAGAVVGAANPGNVTQPEPTRSVSITLASGFMNDQLARELAEAIDEAVGDGVNVRYIGRR